MDQRQQASRDVRTDGFRSRDLKLRDLRSRGLEPRDASLGEVRILRFDDKPECEVIVLLRGRQLVLRCPNYASAVKWARVECKSYGIPGNFPDH